MDAASVARPDEPDRMATAHALGRRPWPAIALLDVAQLPHSPDARWVGPAVFFRGGPPSVRTSVVGACIDRQRRRQPNRGLVCCLTSGTRSSRARSRTPRLPFTTTTRVQKRRRRCSLRCRRRKPQNWDLETLLDTLNETLDLAKVRAVDGELLPLGQLLPAIYLAANPRRDTVSTDLRAILQRSEAIR